MIININNTVRCNTVATIALLWWHTNSDQLVTRVLDCDANMRLFVY